MTELQCPSKLIMLRIIHFYSKNEGNPIDIVMQIVNQKTPLSLRLLDWLVTNYAKSHSVKYIMNNRVFNMFKSYKEELTAFSKKYFDPFCRRERIFYCAKKHNYIEIKTDEQLIHYSKISTGFITTVGQLNFFMWAIMNNVISYAIKNHEVLEENMNKMNKKNTKSKRTELSPDLSKGMTCCQTKVIVDFS